MDQKEAQIKRSLEETREAMSGKIDMLESRIHQAMEGPKSTITAVMGSIDCAKVTIEDTKSVMDNGIDTINRAVDEVMASVKPIADLIAQVKQDPWILFSSAILMGYIIGSLDRGDLFTVRRAHTQAKESRGLESQTPASPLPGAS